MLPLSLVTNEVRNASGTEIEFEKFDSNGRMIEYSKKLEAPNAEFHILVSHQELGTGIEARRRSAIIVTKQVVGASGKQRVQKASKVFDIPIGDIANYDDTKEVNAVLLSFGSTTDGTTLLLTGAGTGDTAVINGSL